MFGFIKKNLISFQFEKTYKIFIVYPNNHPCQARKTLVNINSHIKLSKEILTFGDIEIEKHKFHCHKSPIFLKDVDIENVLISKKISSGEKNYKYFNTLLVTCMMIIKLSQYI